MEKKVQKIIDKVRPYIQMHGGDVFLVDIKDGFVRLKVTGNCVGCQLADLTYNKILGSIIKEEVPGVKKIIIEN